jgi:hypothetical protein
MREIAMVTRFKCMLLQVWTPGAMPEAIMVEDSEGEYVLFTEHVLAMAECASCS